MKVGGEVDDEPNSEVDKAVDEVAFVNIVLADDDKPNTEPKTGVVD